MLNIDERLNYLENKKALLKALPFYEFLLSIEATYQKNSEFCSFSYEYKSSAIDQLNYIKDNDRSGNILVFNKSIMAFPTNEYGMRDFKINSDFFENISCNIYNFKQLLINSGFDESVFFKKYKQDFESVLDDFSWLKKREDRFDLYKKYMHRKIPEYTKIIEKWKQGDITHILSDAYFLNNDEELLNLKYKKIDLKDIEREQSKLLFYKKIIFLKEMLQDYPCIDHFVISANLEKNYSIKINNHKIIFSSLPDSEIQNEIYLKFIGKYDINYPLKGNHLINLNNFILSQKTKINNSLPIINLMGISKEETDQFESELEKKFINRKLKNNDEDIIIKKQKRL